MTQYPYYGNGYYPQPMQDNLAQLRQQPMMPQTPQNNGVQWVSSEMEARGWMIAPNSAVALWDSSAPRVYLKQADASGKPTLTVYDLVERTETLTAPAQAPAVSYVTRDEFDKLAALVADLKGKKKHKEDDEDE